MKKVLIGLLALVAVVSTGLYFLINPPSVAHENIIPDDATAVAIVDAKEMLKETGIKLEFDKVRDIKVDVDFRHPVYAFLTQEGYVGLIAVVSDADDLESNLDGVRQSEGFTWGITDGFLVCHDGKRVLLFGPDLSWENKMPQKTMVELMQKQATASVLYEDIRKEEGSFRAKASFETIISLFAKGSTSDIKEEVRQRLSNHSEKNALIDMESLYVDLVGKFTNNSVALSASLTSTDQQTSDILEEYKKSLRTITRELDTHIPQDPAMWMCTNINGPAVYSTLTKDRDVAAQIKMVDMFINVSDMLNALNGDVLLVLGDVTNRDWKLGMVAQVDNTAFLTPQLKRTLGLLDIRVGKHENTTRNSIYVTNDSRMEQNMTVGGYQFDAQDGYNEECTFFLTADAHKVMQAAQSIKKTYKDASGIFDFFSQDVDKINVRATRDEVKCQLVLKSSINDCLNKWTE